VFSRRYRVLIISSRPAVNGRMNDDCSIARGWVDPYLSTLVVGSMYEDRTDVGVLIGSKQLELVPFGPMSNNGVDVFVRHSGRF
jgi:hypothetical protein